MNTTVVEYTLVRGRHIANDDQGGMISLMQCAFEGEIPAETAMCEFLEDICVDHGWPVDSVDNVEVVYLLSDGKINVVLEKQRMSVQ